MKPAETFFRLTMAVLAGLTVAVLLGADGASASHSSSQTVRDDHLEKQLSSYVERLDAEYGIAVVSLKDSRSIFINADEPFLAASMYKLLVMYRVFEAMYDGRLSPGDQITISREDGVSNEFDFGLVPGEVVTVERLLELAVTESSNTASFALTRAVGGWEFVETAARDLGMESTYLDGEDYWSTPGDMARFFRKLGELSLISQKASEGMVALLHGQKKDDRIPALLPEKAAVAHKTGELGGVRNDGGIVYAPRGWYVIVTMSQGGNPDEQIPAEARISRMVFDRLGT